VVIVLLHRGVYVPVILAHLFAFLNTAMIGSIFMMFEDNRKSVNFTSAQIFQIDRLIQLAVGFPRIDVAFVSHSVESADLNGLLQMYVKIKYIKSAALSIRC